MMDFTPHIVSGSEQRQEIIRKRLLETSTPISTSQLATELSVSVSTIDRDLAALRDAGFKVRSVRGRSGGLIVDSSDSSVTKNSTDESTRAFIGREPQLSALLQAVTMPSNSGTTVLSLSGEPGIGKTRLMQEFTSQCDDRDIKVYQAACVDLPGAPPLRPWSQVLDLALGSAKSAELIATRTRKYESTLSNIDQIADRYQFFEAICQKLSNSITRPSAIVFDDIQNADAASSDLLEHLVSTTSNTKLSVVFAYDNRAVLRNSHLQRLLGRLTSKRQFQRLNVGPLSAEETDELIRRLSPRSLSDEERTEIHTRSEGNPHFATELINHFSLDKSDDMLGGRFRSNLARVPEGIRDAVSSRLDGCSEECRQLLTVAALTGNSFETGKLESIFAPDNRHSEISFERDAIRAIIDEAVDIGAIEQSGHSGSFGFTQHMIRETLLDKISPAQHVRYSAQIASGLESFYGVDANSRASELAHHFINAEPVTGQHRVTEYSILAGEQCLTSFNFEEAEKHFKAVRPTSNAELSQDHVWRARLGLTKASAATLARSETHQAVQMLADVVDHYVAAENIEDAALAALTEITPISRAQPGATDICAVIEKVIDRVDDQPLLKGHLLAKHSHALAVEQNELVRSEKSAREALEIGQAIGDRQLVLRAKRSLIGIRFYAGSEAFDEIPVKALIREADEIGDFDTELRCRFYLVSSMITDSALATTRIEATTFLERAEIYSEVNSLQQALGLATHVLIQLGEFDEAQQLAQRNLELDSRSSWATAPIFAIRSELEEMDSVRQFENSGVGDPKLPLVTRARNATSILLSNPLPLVDDFLHIASSISRELSNSLGNVHRAHPARIAALRLTALVAIADEDRTQAELSYSEILATPKSSLQTDGVHRDRILARLASFIGSKDLAEKHLRSAMGHAENTGAKVQLAHLLCDNAELMIQRRETRSIDLVISRALKFANELGLESVKSRITNIESSLASEGKNRTGSKIMGRLSPRESEVLALVSRGLRNREIASDLFLSERTVQRHIANIYEKIGARNRSEATAYAISRSAQ